MLAVYIKKKEKEVIFGVFCIADCKEQNRYWMLMVTKGSARKETLGTGGSRGFIPNLQILTGCSLYSSMFFGTRKEHPTQDTTCIYATKCSDVKVYLHH